MKKPVIALLILPFLFFVSSCNRGKASDSINGEEKKTEKQLDTLAKKQVLSIDTTDYNKRMVALSNNDTTGRWPVKAPYPLPGALLPYNRIIAYYGNLYSTRMGILGELPRNEMIKKLQGEIAKWQAVDPSVKTIPALHYIAVTAQGAPGKDNKHRMRMPFKQIDTILSWAKPINALVFLDIQVGHSTVKAEVAELEKYLALPNVHLGIDPEFSMKNGERPGSKIGYFTAADINDAIDILANIVRKNKLTPKVLVVHRFTQGMVKKYKEIKTVPEVQIVMDMDGFGDKVLKKDSYRSYIYREPVQFTGFKLFYKNDIRKNWVMYTPAELMKFTPKPIYIQYQ
ncbi:hypothetical protein ACM55G_02125 [Flavobacterium sp. LB3P122]|uniref:hypothetical protein n=1 Tax=Flavobacterium algoriphilum TaxID=3398738 RepID=UPI003A84BA14